MLHGDAQYFASLEYIFILLVCSETNFLTINNANIFKSMSSINLNHLKLLFHSKVSNV